MIFIWSHSKKILFNCLLLLLIAAFTELPAQLRINEVVGSSDWTLRDDGGQFPDWVELYNMGTSSIQLENHRISDSADFEQAWEFPQAILSPGTHLLIYASGENRVSGSNWHTHFTISAGGDEIFLFSPDGEVIDHVPEMRYPTDISLGRYPDGTGDWFYHTVPTPGSTNLPSTLSDWLEPPTFSHAAGYHPDSFDLLLTHPDEGVVIRFTLDGSIPDETSPALDGSIPITPRSHEPDVYTRIPPTYSTSPFTPRRASFKGTVVRARAFSPGSLPSRAVTRTFFAGEDPFDTYGLPVVSLVVEPDDFFSHEWGIHVKGVANELGRPVWLERYTNPNSWSEPGNFHQRGRTRIPLHGITPVDRGDGLIGLPLPNHGFDFPTGFWNYFRTIPMVQIKGTGLLDGSHIAEEGTTNHEVRIRGTLPATPFPHGSHIMVDWERPTHFEFFGRDGDEIISMGLGSRIHGNATRRSPQKTLRLYARNSYDENNTIEYPLIDSGSHVPAYRRLLLRRSTQDSGLTCIYSTHLLWLFNPSMDVQHFRLATTFLNGEFWGWFALRDRLDEWYVAHRHGVDPEDIVILTGQYGGVDHGNPEDRGHFTTLYSLVHSGDMTQPGRLEQIEALLDVESYMDYTAGSIILANEDWWSKHLQAWRYKGPQVEGGHESLDGRLRYMPFDFDSALGVTLPAQHDFLAFILTEPTYFIYRLHLIPEFRRRYINRFADMLNTVFLPEYAIAVVEEIVDTLPETLRQHHVDRWLHFPNLAAWESNHQSVIDFLQERPDHMRQHVMDNFDLEGVADVTLHANTVHGRIMLNRRMIDETTPRSLSMADNDVYPWSGIYFSGVPVEVRAVPNPGWFFEQWEGDSTSTTNPLLIDPADGIYLEAIFRKALPDGFELERAPLTAQSGKPARRMTVGVVLEDGSPATDFDGIIELSLVDGPSPLAGTLSLASNSGSASFNNVVFPTPGVYTIRFTSGELPGHIDHVVEVAGLEEVIVPRYIQGANPNNDRVPFAFRLSISGLRPHTPYKYANRFVVEGDSATQNGAGNALYYDRLIRGWRRTTSTPDFTDEETHGRFASDGDGNYTGWFLAEPSGNQRFTPGNKIRIRILIDEGYGGTEYYHYLTASSPINVVSFGGLDANATGVAGIGGGDPGDFLFLYDAIDGSARPLAGTVVENDMAATDDRYAAFYTQLVDGRDGAWGTLVPNRLPGGIQRISIFSGLYGDEVRSMTSTDGFWPQDTETRNPNQGLFPLIIDLNPFAKTNLWMFQ